MIKVVKGRCDGEGRFKFDRATKYRVADRSHVVFPILAAEILPFAISFKNVIYDCFG
jgi:hypothetical protein